jgi:1-aminocyclopropane-1-carboxylate deaminase/D-cysteine desulfhydrase-like pyridoxal-dependent ACC family enzyme
MLPATIPRASLGVVPSPLESFPLLAGELGVDSLLVKRDDLSGADFGGNKRRALEFLLADSEFVPVSMGGFGSTWCAALAALAVRNGRPAHLALFPQPWTPTVAGLLSTSLLHGEVSLAASRWGVPFAVWRAVRAASRRGRARWIAPGGASPVGVLGSINAALELVAQVGAQRLARPEAVIVPLGSGGTAAGLLIGFRLAGWPVDIMAVRVADRWVANRWQVGRLVRATERILRHHGTTVPSGSVRLTVVGTELGAGYGHATERARATQARFAREGIGLDLTYSAKAAAALQAAATRFRHLCFWHTFDQRLMSSPLLHHPQFQRAQALAESSWPHTKST